MQTHYMHMYVHTQTIHTLLLDQTTPKTQPVMNGLLCLCNYQTEHGGRLVRSKMTYHAITTEAWRWFDHQPQDRPVDHIPFIPTYNHSIKY